MESKKHFVLVHGAGHGAWCWFKLVPLLESAGHKVTALDLAACGINSKQLDDMGSFSDYVQPLLKFLASLPQDEKLILVGHSFGGYCISLAMENFPEKIMVAVFVSAFMPNHTSPQTSDVLQEDLELAKMLVRPHGLLRLSDKDSVLTKGNFGSANRVFVVCGEDESINEEFQRWMIENSPPNEVKYISEAGHMVMLSKPKQLCQCLLEIVENY